MAYQREGFRAPVHGALAAIVPAGLAILVAGAACGGADLPNPDERDEDLLDVTRADLVGPLCSRRSCECASAPAEAGEPAAGDKRYEIRVGPMPDEMWVTVGDDVLYKSRERSTECFYVDLSPGEHRVAARVRGSRGFSAAVKISELGDSPVEDYEGPWWLDTFRFNCGAPGRCTTERLDHWRDRFRGRAERNILDPCGSTAVRDIAWRTGELRERIYPRSLHLEFTLDIYDFDPIFPPGHRECAG